ncbi:MAG: hypothetical protein NT115_14050 [Proteobacteria bacterium]|nr:hypothetical protein [Pseudomonadota bacterium]
MAKERFIATPADLVIPAQAGIHLDLKLGFIESKWIPACAGMTIYGLNQSFPKERFIATPADLVIPNAVRNLLLIQTSSRFLGLRPRNDISIMSTAC